MTPRAGPRLDQGRGAIDRAPTLVESIARPALALLPPPVRLRPPYGPPAPQGDRATACCAPTTWSVPTPVSDGEGPGIRSNPSPQALSGAASPFNAAPLLAPLISGGTAISRSS